MPKSYDDEYLEEEDNIYNEDSIENLEENDEINPNESAFIEGYIKEDKKKKHKKKSVKKK